jgi:hypothetical protein
MDSSHNLVVALTSLAFGEGNTAFRKRKAEECGIGFELPSALSVGTECTEKAEKSKAQKSE